jgi:tRNA(Ile)-lysidine synthase
LIKIQGKIDREVNVACSGGIDSMAVVDFLMQNHKVNLLFFDHGTETSTDARNFITEKFTQREFSDDTRVEFGNVQNTKSKSESWEEYWRNERYAWFHSFDSPVITCHHLDDCVETWLWSSIHGNGKIIPYANLNVIRPFRQNRKAEFANWARRKDVSWIEDVSNQDVKYMRNFIRRDLMPKALVVNPGLHKVVEKKVGADAP